MKKTLALLLFLVILFPSLNVAAKSRDKFATCVLIGRDFRIITDQKEAYLPLGVTLKKGSALRSLMQNLVGTKLRISNIQSGKPVSHALIYFTMDESSYESMMGRIFVKGRAPFPKEYFLNEVLIEKGLAQKKGPL